MESQPGDGAEKMEARGKKAGSLERGTEEADKRGRGWLVGKKGSGEDQASQKAEGARNTGLGKKEGIPGRVWEGEPHA